MNARETSKAFSPRFLTGMLAVCLFGFCMAHAQTKPKDPKPAAAAPKPATKAAAPAAGKGSGASTAAGHSPTTSAPGHGATTSTAGHGATTASPGHSAATTAGHTPGAAGHSPGAAGHSPAAANHGGAPGRTANGHSAPNGHTTMHTANGNAVTRRPGGRVAEVHDARRGMDIHHGLSGNRRVAVERSDHSRIVAERGGRGYVQRPYMYRGHEFAHRTYYANGRAYDRFYRGYPYHGVYVEMYTPAYYYRPAFYGWAYNPWVAPVPYAWGFAANPWYGYYGAYFTPYPVYPSASVWLTDYMISQTLAAAYQANAAAAAGQAQAMANAAALTPQVKDLIAAEVQRQIALANSESQTVAQNAQVDPASSGIQRMLTDNIKHVFVAGRDLDLVDAGGAECAITEGDALQLVAGPPAANSTDATLVVLSNKGGVECRKGATVTVAVADLQDMQNHMRETIDAGMGELQSKQGKGGLPSLPPSANAPPVKTAFAAEAPPPDPTASTQINQQMQEADKAEQEVVGQASGPSDGAGPSAAPATPAAAPKEVSLGLSIDEITAILGPPKTKADLGAKKIYMYKDMKITFTGGKVTDIQ